ncbi:MAG: YeiH family protein [Rectinemataceae bacterium]
MNTKPAWPLGVLLTLALAIPAWLLGKIVPIVGAPIFAILMGMLLSFIKRPYYLEQGIRVSGKKILQYSIVFLGFSLDLGVVVRVGTQSLAVMLFTLSAAFLTAYLVGKALGLAANTKILIGVGTSICGGSAIAATAPVIEADDKEVAFAISTIFLFNIIAVFVFPALGHLMRMSDGQFGLWAGTAINDTSSVVAAAFSYSDQAGRYATVVKLTRTLMIIPITLVLAFTRKHGAGKAGSIHFMKIFPWFVLGFLATSLVRTAEILPAASYSVLNDVGKFGICTAMVAIGLNTKPKELIRNGMRPILLGLACWVAVALVSLAVQGLGI